MEYAVFSSTFRSFDVPKRLQQIVSIADNIKLEDIGFNAARIILMASLYQDRLHNTNELLDYLKKFDQKSINYMHSALLEGKNK